MEQKKKVSKNAINKRIMELIKTGVLLEKDGFNALYRHLIDEFPNNKFDKRRFKNRIFNLIFVSNKDIDQNLQNIVRAVAKTSLEKSKLKKIVEQTHSIYPFIPEEFVIRRAKWHRGLISGGGKKLMGKTLPGIGRIDLSGGTLDFEIPRAGFEKPFSLEVEPSEKPISIMVLNGTNLGIKHGADIVGNVARRALSEAEERQDKAVILTNFLCFDLKKAGGPAKTARAQVLGDNINPELIQDPFYRQVVEQIIAAQPMNQIAYRTPEELVNDVLGGWTKICTKPNHKLEYNRPIYIIIGLNELALIFAVTYWEIRWWTHKKQIELRNDIRIAKKAIKEAEKRLREAEKKHADAKDIKELHKNAAEAHERLKSLEHQLARTTISDVANQESQRFFTHAYSVVVQKIEEAIPGAKVIGEGTSYIQIGDKKIEFYIPPHLRITDALLNDYSLSYGPKTLRQQMADAVVICHPWALQYRTTTREVDYDGKRNSIKIHVAPTAVDDNYLRSELSSLRIKDHPIMKAVYNETFKAGVLRLWLFKDTIEADEIAVGALEKFKHYPRIKMRKKEIRGSRVYKRGPRYLWLMSCSDHHWGGRSKEFVWDEARKMRLSMAEAVFEMMRREGLCENTKIPIHFLCSPDDPTQGQNIKYRTELHPHQIPYHLIEKITGNLLAQAESARTKKEIIKIADKIRRLALYQLEKRGSDFIFEQLMQMMERHIESNLDVFSAILRRALAAKVKIKGVGEIVAAEYGGYDSRNIGLINFGTGNHFAITTDFEMIEGPLYAQRLRDLLCATKEWKGQDDLIKQLVVSPVYGQTCIGWGIISVKGKHEYGLEIRSRPTNMAGWGDPLRGHVKRDLQRGNYTRIWNKKLPVIKFFGDKHFFSGVSTSYAIYHMSPAAVHTDVYGERGFPPNSTGVSFLGVPVDGPESGPILWRTLPFEVIKEYMENPRSFDWNEFLPYPA